MNQGGYYGAYRGGFQTLPKGAYEMMTAPTQINGETIKKAASSIGSMVQKYADQQAGSEASQQGAAAQYKGLESISQATGVPMNPELADQFKNMSSMSSQQQAVFQNSLGQEAQRMQMLYGINQAQARAAQAQGQMQGADFSQSNASRILGAPMGGGGSATAAPQAPSFNVVGAAPENQLAQVIGEDKKQPLKAFVVSNEVTNAQALDRNIVEGASIG